MKKIFLVAATLFIIQILQAQNGARLHTYKQQVSSGIRPETVIGEEGEMVQAPAKTRYNLWIYFSHPQKSVVKITGLYLNGKKYKTKQSKVPQTPVIHNEGDTPEFSKSVTLVPKTKNVVVLIEPAGIVAFKPSTTLKKMITKNEVVLSYTIKGKTYYISSKQMKELKAAAMV